MCRIAIPCLPILDAGFIGASLFSPVFLSDPKLKFVLQLQNQGFLEIFLSALYSIPGHLVFRNVLGFLPSISTRRIQGYLEALAEGMVFPAFWRRIGSGTGFSGKESGRKNKGLSNLFRAMV